jgi:hypothetical protein
LKSYPNCLVPVDNEEYGDGDDDEDDDNENDENEDEENEEDEEDDSNLKRDESIPEAFDSFVTVDGHEYVKRSALHYDATNQLHYYVDRGGNPQWLGTTDIVYDANADESDRWGYLHANQWVSYVAATRQQTSSDADIGESSRSRSEGRTTRKSKGKRRAN